MIIIIIIIILILNNYFIIFLIFNKNTNNYNKIQDNNKIINRISKTFFYTKLKILQFFFFYNFIIITRFLSILVPQLLKSNHIFYVNLNLLKYQL